MLNVETPFTSEGKRNLEAEQNSLWDRSPQPPQVYPPLADFRSDAFGGFASRKIFSAVLRLEKQNEKRVSLPRSPLRRHRLPKIVKYK